VNELLQTRHTHARESASVVLAAPEHEHARRCLASLRQNTPADVELLRVDPNASAVNRALRELWPADAVIFTEPCLVVSGWFERLRAVAHEDTNIATVSALVDRGGALALHVEDPADPPSDDVVAPAAPELDRLVAALAERTLSLHPRLSRACGPCVYVRREAHELVGDLDESLELHCALEDDFAQRCVLSGLTHVAADDVLVGRLDRGRGAPAWSPPTAVLERYPYLHGHPPLADSGVLAHALAAARDRRARLWVTVDARALDGAVTGTQVHVLELIRALAETGRLRLRLLVRGEQIDAATLALLRALPETEILFAEDLDPATPRSTVFHRPQQTFSAGDVALALALGERFVLSQLDLIAYRNPGYFADGEAWQDYRRASRHGLSAAERVVVFSEHTRGELLADALVDAPRMSVVPPGLDHRRPHAPRPPQAIAEADTPPADGFLLCLGTDFRHKNRLFALRLLAELRERHDWRGSLVFAGTHVPIGSSTELERAFLAERPALRDAVVALGAVDEQEKAWLLAHAGALVYPSVYEGFGLVPFESALAGVPCVFAPQASLAEETPAGSASIVPWDAQASAAAANTLLTDARARDAHVQALARAARELTWTAAAAHTVEVYWQAALAPVRDAATLSRDAVQRERRLSVEHELETARLTREREHAQRMYDELNAQVGFGLGLIGPGGSLPEDLQRALLALSARPALARPLFAALARAFTAVRALARVLGRGSRDR
jgi:glycosyltransferase involved in cell wall biosynthesis